MTASALLGTVKLSLFISLQPAVIKSVCFLTVLPTLGVISLVFINKMWQLWLVVIGLTSRVLTGPHGTDHIVLRHLS